MNFLAHLFLAESHSASRVGNLLGDFVTGTPASLRSRFPGPVLAGIIRHRALDAWTDAHAVTAELKPLLHSSRRRFAGAVIDVFHDYFLALHWSEFSAQPQRDFLDECYAALREHRALLPAELGGDLDERLANDWLGHYGTMDGLADVFARMARRRSPAFAPLHDSVDDLRAAYPAFEAGFRSFFLKRRTG